jgi:hypothetical protein
MAVSRAIFTATEMAGPAESIGIAKVWCVRSQRFAYKQLFLRSLLIVTHLVSWFIQFVQQGN